MVLDKLQRPVETEKFVGCRVRFLNSVRRDKEHVARFKRNTEARIDDGVWDQPQWQSGTLERFDVPVRFQQVTIMAS